MKKKLFVKDLPQKKQMVISSVAVVPKFLVATSLRFNESAIVASLNIKLYNQNGHSIFICEFDIKFKKNKK